MPAGHRHGVRPRPAPRPAARDVHARAARPAHRHAGPAGRRRHAVECQTTSTSCRRTPSSASRAACCCVTRAGRAARQALADRPFLPLPRPGPGRGRRRHRPLRHRHGRRPGPQGGQGAGGFTMVQSPASAKLRQHAAQRPLTGRVDHVLPVEEMPAKLVEQRGTLRDLGGRPRPGRAARGGGAAPRGDLRAPPRPECGTTSAATSRATLIRRVRRRMQLARRPAGGLRRAAAPRRAGGRAAVPGPAHRRHPLLPRPRRPSTALEARGRLPKLFEGTGARTATVRVWVPGCATGEEAYSIAILLREQLRRSARRRHSVQIFATDIDEQALEAARQALLPGDRSPTRSRPSGCERFFVKHGEPYQVAKEVRDLCLFSHPQPDRRPAVLAPRPDLLPQPADLPRARPAEAG